MLLVPLGRLLDFFTPGVPLDLLSFLRAKTKRVTYFKYQYTIVIK
jgi:hypothetical protein